MKKKLILTMSLAITAIAVNAQLRQSDVIAAGGDYVEKGSLSLSSTIGEPIGGTFEVGTIVLVQGFQQALAIGGGSAVNEDAATNLASNVKIYPSPVGAQLNVEFTEEIGQNLQVQILNTVGAMVISENFEFQNIVNIVTADLPKGIYLVKIIADNEIIKTQKVVKL